MVSLHPATPSPPSWTDSIRPSLAGEFSWSVYTDASWRPILPLPAQAVFGLQGSHEGQGALFLSADSPDWCSSLAGVRFEIPPILQALGGTAHVAELLAIHAGLYLLHTLNLRGTVYSDCLAAVKKITRRWTPGRACQDTGATLVAAARALLSDSVTVQWIKGHPERSDLPPHQLVPATVGNLRGGCPNQEPGDRHPPALTHPLPPDTPDPLLGPPNYGQPARPLAMG